MSVVSFVVLFFVGGCVGSFCDCVAYRIPRKMNWITGRSICPNCHKELSALELIPVVSILALRAHCSKCGFYYGWSNLFTEFSMGCLYSLIWLTPLSIYFQSSLMVLITLIYFLFRLALEKKICRDHDK